MVVALIREASTLKTCTLGSPLIIHITFHDPQSERPMAGRSIQLPHLSPSLRSSTSTNRRACSSPPRRITLLFLIIISVLSFDGIFTHKLIGHKGIDPLAMEEGARVDDELISVLVKTKQAMEKRTKVEDLAGFADRVMVLDVSTHTRKLSCSRNWRC